MKKFEKKTLDKKAAKETANAASIVKQVGAAVATVGAVIIGIGKLINEMRKQ